MKSKRVTIALVMWSLLNCWTRLYLGVHYPGDVLVGIAWGALAGGLVYMLYVRAYRKLSTGSRYVSSYYTSSGYERRDMNLILNILFLIVAYTFIRGILWLIRNMMNTNTYTSATIPMSCLMKDSQVSTGATRPFQAACLQARRNWGRLVLRLTVLFAPGRFDDIQQYAGDTGPSAFPQGDGSLDRGLLDGAGLAGGL